MQISQYLNVKERIEQISQYQSVKERNMQILQSQSIKEYVENIISIILMQKQRTLGDDEKLSDLGLDSYDMTDLVITIETDISDVLNMNIIIEDEDFFVCSTVGDVVSLIRKEISSRSGS